MAIGAAACRFYLGAAVNQKRSYGSFKNAAGVLDQLYRPPSLRCLLHQLYAVTEWIGYIDPLETIKWFVGHRFIACVSAVGDQPLQPAH